MIPFNIFGHSKGVNLSDPIVWVDAQDISTYNYNINGWTKTGTNNDNNFIEINSLGCRLVSDGTSITLTSDEILEIGKNYKIEWEVVQNILGSAKMSRMNPVKVFSSLGSYTHNFTATSTRFDYARTGSGTDITINNVSVKEDLGSGNYGAELLINGNFNDNDVTNLDNKGTLGGAMTLNGSVKFANNGFESWSLSDYISRDLGEPFLTDNSFTFVTTFFLKDITSGSFANRNWFSLLLSDIENLLTHYKINNNLGSAVRADDISKTDFINYQLGIHTLIISYNIDSNTLVLLNDNGVSTVFNNVVFDNVVNSKIQLLSAIGYSNTNSGQDNPLYDFRLYDKSFTLTEMQDLQIELNDKYTP